MKATIQTGDRYGKLTTIEVVSKTNRGANRWLCECDCGKKTVVIAYNLRNGHTKSCGCMSIKNSSKSINIIKTTICNMLIEAIEKHEDGKYENKEFSRGEICALLKVIGSNDIFTYEEYDLFQKKCFKIIR